MDNPRDWSGGLVLIARQAVIITFCVLFVFGSCAFIWHALITG